MLTTNFSFLLWIPALIMLIYYLKYQRSNRRNFGPISFLLFAYVSMALVSAFSGMLFGIVSVISIQMMPMLYLSICILIAFWGFSSYRDMNVVAFEIDNYRLIRFLEMFLLFTSFAAICFFLPTAISALHGNVDENRKNLVDITEHLKHFGYINSFFSLISNMFAINIVLAFLNLTPDLICRRGSKLRSILLLVSSADYVVYILAYVGRDGAVFWVLTFAYLYLFFKKFLLPKWASAIKYIALSVVLSSLIPFAIITISRFRENPLGILGSLWLYIGNQINAFNDQFITFSAPQYGQVNFPLFFKLFHPFDGKFDRADWYSLYTNEGVMPWHFSTFVGSFLFDFGYFLTPLLILTIAIVTRFSLRGVSKRGVIKFSQLLIFLLCSQIVLYGIFYFRQYSANLYLVAIILLAFLFKLARSRKSSRILMSLEYMSAVASIGL